MGRVSQSNSYLMETLIPEQPSQGAASTTLGTSSVLTPLGYGMLLVVTYVDEILLKDLIIPKLLASIRLKGLATTSSYSISHC